MVSFTIFDPLGSTAIRRRLLILFAHKKNPRQPCQRGFPKSSVEKLGKRWS
jgi:hypothetical protein